MTDADLRECLRQRFEHAHQCIQVACARVGRDPREVLLIAVTKTVSPRVTQMVVDLGYRDLGESRPQALWQKCEQVRGTDLRWHLIGHLQRNKIERTLPLLSVIHSVDSIRLAESLDQAAREPISVLLEVNASREDNKDGFAPEELPSLANAFARFSHLQVVGLMTMAAYADEPESSRATFAEVRALRDRLRPEWATWTKLEHLSMGMSNDYEIAIEEGATMIRLGTTLFDGLGEE